MASRGSEGFNLQEITLTSSERRLSAHLITPRPPRSSQPGILFIHGLHSDQKGYLPRAEAAASQLGAACVTFDLGGHGSSEGALEELTPRDHLLDVLAAYECLKAQSGVDTERIGVCAASYGAYLAALLVSRRPVRRMILRAPALYVDSQIDTPLGQGLRSGFPPQAAKPLENVGRLGGNLLVVESENDEIIPPSLVLAYLQAAPGAAHHVIRGARHALDRPEWREEFMKLILGWFQDL